MKSQCLFSIKKIQGILKNAPNQVICALTRCICRNTKVLGDSVWMAFHGLFRSLVTWHRFLQSTSISGLFLLGRSVICLSLIIPSGEYAWGTQVSCSLCAQRNYVVTLLFSQLWFLWYMGRCLLGAALPWPALYMTLEKSFPLQFYGESLLYCSAIGICVFIP